MSYLRNKAPREPVVHFMSNWSWSTMTSCGQHAIENKEPRPNIIVTLNPSKVTCGSCVRTTFYKRRLAMSPKHEATVGIPTQPESEERPVSLGKVMQEAAQVFTPPQSNSFGGDEPLIHAQLGGGNPMPLCTNNDDAKWTEGYSTMDGGAVTCRYCLQDPLFIQRNNMFTEMMSPSHGEGEAEPAAIVHDRADQDDYGTPNYMHDCDACVFLGEADDYDLYWCSQGGGTNISTVIARFSSNGPDYISGLAHARGNEKLALAVVRAFRKGLLDDADLGWL